MNANTLRSFVILGDSYSTFTGWVPDTHAVYYPSEGIPDVSAVEQTWWHQLMTRLGLTLLKNDSWSGSTVCAHTREGQGPESAFVHRMHDLLAQTQPDLILIFGGTNDDWLGRDIGSVQTGDFTADSDKRVLPAFCHLFAHAKATHPAARVVCIVNTDFQPALHEGLMQACAHFGVQCVELRDIDKTYGHPNALGMTQIADQLEAALRA